MPGRSVTALLNVAALLAAGLFCCPCGDSANSGPQPPEAIVRESDEAAARERAQTLKELQEAFEKFRSMCKEAGIEVKPNELPDPFGILGLDRIKERGEAAARAAARIEVTARDLQALDPYADGEFQKVEEMLSETADPSERRPFPLFLRGCALLELKRFADAAACFDEALSLEKESRMSCLLGEMCRLLEKSPEATDEEIMAAYDFAYKTCLERMPPPKKEGDEFSLADFITSPVTADPILVRLDQAAARIRELRSLAIVQDFIWETDLDRRIALALMMPEQARPAILSLSREHPEKEDLQVFAFLLRYYSSAVDKLSERNADYARDLAAAQAAEPENGCLVLLGIPDTDANYKTPLSAAETDILHRAVRCKEFHTYSRFGFPEVEKESRVIGGECFKQLNYTRPLVGSPIRQAARRAGATIAGLFREEKISEAEALLAGVRLLVGKVRADQSDSVLWLMSADRMADSVDREVVAYAVKAKRADLLEKAVAEREEEMRFEAVVHVAATNLPGYIALPLRRTREAGNWDPPGLYESRASRLLKLYPDRFRDEAIENLRYVSAEGRTYLGSYEYGAVVILQMLKDPKALPVLEPLAGHADPLLSRLARKAIADIKSNP